MAWSSRVAFWLGWWAVSQAVPKVCSSKEKAGVLLGFVVELVPFLALYPLVGNMLMVLVVPQ